MIDLVVRGLGSKHEVIGLNLSAIIVRQKKDINVVDEGEDS